jgi:lipoprotein-anchoring transpeptidase ErfK/SrfK
MTRPERIAALALLTLLAFPAGCRGNTEPASVPIPEQREGTAPDRGSRDGLWREHADRDLAARGGAAASATGEGSLSEETFDQITPASVNSEPLLPLEDGEGPSVLLIQILLDRANFSPGVIDGYWGDNTAKAIYWFQHANGLQSTGTVDRPTFQQLMHRAGEIEAIIPHRLTEDDVEGPFVTLPSSVYELAEMNCLCYESLSEKLGEVFHSSENLLRQLNPGVSLNSLSAGDIINVPSIRGRAPRDAAQRVAKVVVSNQGSYTHALDENGLIVYHFPSTLGAAYDQVSGELTVRAIARDPDFHYQPMILSYVDDDKPEALLPPGPNSPVGVMWIALSRQSYGIHGTNSPSTIGYATSAGCVRLTNWDALRLAEEIEEGMTVEFR